MLSKVIRPNNKAQLAMKLMVCTTNFESFLPNYFQPISKPEHSAPNQEFYTEFSIPWTLAPTLIQLLEPAILNHSRYVLSNHIYFSDFFEIKHDSFY